VGLLPPATRSDTGYRQYGEREVHVLRFIRRARDLGFSIKDISGLLSLWHDRQRPSRQVKALAQAHMQQLQRKIDELQSMRQTLEKLVQCCQGDERPDCPILQDLAGS
jgi:MerR family copper efflux transcriptional regulator